MRVRPKPIFPTIADIPKPPEKPPKPKANEVPPVATAKPIKATPNIAFPAPPEPVITGIK